MQSLWNTPFFSLPQVWQTQECTWAQTSWGCRSLLAHPEAFLFSGAVNFAYAMGLKNIKKVEGSWWWKMDFHCFSIERVYSNLVTQLESWQRIGERGIFWSSINLLSRANVQFLIGMLSAFQRSVVKSRIKPQWLPVSYWIPLGWIIHHKKKKFQFFLDIPKRHFVHSTAVFSLDQGILSRKLKRIKVLLLFSVCFRESSACLYWFSHFFFQQIFMSAVNMSHALKLNTGNIEINKKIAFPFLKELSLFGNGDHTNKSAWLYRK